MVALGANLSLPVPLIRPLSATYLTASANQSEEATSSKPFFEGLVSSILLKVGVIVTLLSGMVKVYLPSDFLVTSTVLPFASVIVSLSS